MPSILATWSAGIGNGEIPAWNGTERADRATTSYYRANAHPTMPRPIAAALQVHEGHVGLDEPGRHMGPRGTKTGSHGATCRIICNYRTALP